MNGFLLLIPLLLIRLVLMPLLNPKAAQEATQFAPLLKNEQWAYYLYQVTNLILLFMPLGLQVTTSLPFILIGGFVYLIGLMIVLLAIIAFSKKEEQTLYTLGI
ncbi:hypothetical protein [Vagococcus silagei]|uniref:Uncharacterized protein n=1 Tax=Vagococcus silagei TaxID=2508885 RepID=A0A4S3B017_9ENTE|nr:hypothetical protein [Vagococcus silagei]THB60092.1 hypothetical protein ESZ54_12250 [Vagococcus silagei]